MALARHKHHSVLRRSLSVDIDNQHHRYPWKIGLDAVKVFETSELWPLHDINITVSFENPNGKKARASQAVACGLKDSSCVMTARRCSRWPCPSIGIGSNASNMKLANTYLMHICIRVITVFKITPSMDIQFVIAACGEDCIARMTSRLQKRNRYGTTLISIIILKDISCFHPLSLSLLIFLSPSLSQSLSFFSSLSLTYLFSCNLSLSLFFFSPSLSLSLSLFLPHKHANILVSCDKLETGYNNSAITLESGN